jgi:hypothetical protein
MPDHSHAACGAPPVPMPVSKIFACLGFVIDGTLALVTAQIASFAATGRLSDFGLLTLLQ